jgi:hypothetical protein
MRFTVPVIRTETGWLDIEAPTKEEAIAKVQAMEANGLHLADMQDSSSETEVQYDEIEETKAREEDE